MKLKFPKNYENQIIQGDCLKLMSAIPDKAVDLVLTDPPYGVRKKEEWDEEKHFKNTIDPWLNECLRVSKTVIWFCAGKMMPLILKNREDIFHRLLIWNKPPGSQYAGAMHSNIWYSIEPILVFGEHLPKDKNKCYGYACFDSRTVPSKAYNHPTSKPLQLMEKLVYFYSNEGDLILDPFSGSGSTAVAAKTQKRRYIGLELSEEHCKESRERLKTCVVRNTLKDALNKKKKQLVKNTLDWEKSD